MTATFDKRGFFVINIEQDAIRAEMQKHSLENVDE